MCSICMPMRRNGEGFGVLGGVKNFVFVVGGCGFRNIRVNPCAFIVAHI